MNLTLKYLVMVCFALTAFESVASAQKDDKTSEYVLVEVQGKMSQVAAIGGETTGIQISANGINWELDLGKSDDLKKIARELFDKKVHVTGELTVKRGVEIRQRWIVKVKSLGPAKKKNKYLVDGKLAKPLVFKDAQGGFAGFSGYLWTFNPDGSWTRQSFLNETVREADQKGKLTKEQLTQLAETLAKQDAIGLPEKIGKDIGANPHVFTISWGDKQSKLIAQAGSPLPDSKDSKSAEARFAAIAKTILELAKPEKK